MQTHYRSFLAFGLGLLLASWTVELLMPLILKPQLIAITISSETQLQLNRILVDGETVAAQQGLSQRLTPHRLGYRFKIQHEGANKARIVTQPVKTTTLLFQCVDSSEVMQPNQLNRVEISSDGQTTAFVPSECYETPVTIKAPAINFWLWWLATILIVVGWQLVIWLLTQLVPPSYRPEPTHPPRPLTTKFWLGFSVMMLIPVVLGLLAFWPGMYCHDGLDQWNQIASGEYRNWHPIIHTVLQIPFAKLQFPAGLPLVQSLALIVLCLRLLRVFYHRLGKFGAAVLILLMFYNPFTLNAINSAWKDVLFSLAVIWVGLDLGEVLQKNRQARLSLVRWLCRWVALFLASTLRHNGIVVGLGVGALYIWQGQKQIKLLAISALGMVLLLPWLYQLLGFVGMPPTISTYTSLHVLVGYARIHPQTELEQFVRQFVSSERLQLYAPDSIDWIILDRDLDHRAVKQAEPEIYRRVGQLLLTDGWTVQQLYSQQLTILTKLLPNQLYGVEYALRETVLDGHPANFTFANLRMAFWQWQAQSTDRVTQWSWLAPPVTLMVAIVLVAIIWFDDSKRRLLWVSIPSLLCYLSVLVSIPAQQYRYTLSLFWLLPLLLAIIISSVLQRLNSIRARHHD